MRTTRKTTLNVPETPLSINARRHWLPFVPASVWPVCLSLLVAGMVSVELGSAAPKPPTVFRAYIEAEDCEGLIRYPYHNEDAQGWYGREASCRSYGAPGKTYCAAIHENSDKSARTMSAKLKEPIPAGSYKVFLRVVGPCSPTRDTVVAVGLGDSSVEFRWKKGDKKFKWLPGLVISLSNKVSSVTFAAVEFGGNGHGGLYEPVFDTIWIDTLYITSDPNEKQPPDGAEEWLVRSGLDPTEFANRPVYQSDEYGYYDPLTPGPEDPQKPIPIKLESFDGRRNLWPDSSFELGMNDGWADRTGHVLTDDDLDSDRPYHGRFALRVSPGSQLFHRPYYLAEPGDYTLSLWVRGGDKGNLALKLMKVPGPGEPGYKVVDTQAEAVTELTQALNNQWQRAVKSVALKPGWYYLSLSNDAPCWLDAIQLEKSAGATDYAPRAGLEGAIRSGRLANIIYQEQQKTLDVWFHNSGKTPVEARLSYRIRDVRDRLVTEGVTPAVPVKPGETVKQPLRILPGLRGLFSLTCAVENRPLPESETVYVVMPEPLKKEVRHALGGHMSYAEQELAVNARLGLRWIANTKIRSGFEAAQLHPKPDVWNWTPEKVLERPSRYGLDEWISFWPSYSPDFMMEAPKEKHRAWRGTAITRLPEMKQWRDYVEKVVSHYRDHYRVWAFDDDAPLYWAPEVSADYMRETRAIIKSISPAILFGTFREPEYIEAMLKTLPPETMDFFGSDSITYQYWPSKKAQHLAQRYGKRYASNGVGGHKYTHTMYHTLYRYRPVYGKAALMARCLIYTMLVQDVQVVNHYTAQLVNRWAHDSDVKSLFDYDGTPLPEGATFGCLGTLLADAVPLGDRPLGNSDKRVFLFRVGPKMTAAAFATSTRANDLFFRPADRVIRGVTFPCPKDSVEAMDMYWNPVSNPKWENSGLILDLNEEPVFIVDKALGDEAFEKMIDHAQIAPQPCELAFELAPGKDCPIALKTTIQNNMTKKMAGVTVDFRFNYKTERHPISIAGTWLLKQPVAKIESIPAGEAKSVMLPTHLDGLQPYEDGRLRANLRTDDGFECAADAFLWFVPARKAIESPVLDGKLNEWEGRSPAWLFYEWAWAPMGRHVVQLDEGGEHFSYPPYYIDGRAAFWASWDKENLYMAVRLEDDQPMLQPKGERVRMVIVVGGKRHTVELRPQSKDSIEAVLNGKPVQSRLSVTEEKKYQTGLVRREIVPTVNIECRLPLAELGIEPKEGMMLGFDLFWTDVDKEAGEVVAGTLRWAGCAQKTGYMMLK